METLRLLRKRSLVPDVLVKLSGMERVPCEMQILLRLGRRLVRTTCLTER